MRQTLLARARKRREEDAVEAKEQAKLVEEEEEEEYFARSDVRGLDGQHQLVFVEAVGRTGHQLELRSV